MIAQSHPTSVNLWTREIMTFGKRKKKTLLLTTDGLIHQLCQDYYYDYSDRNNTP